MRITDLKEFDKNKTYYFFELTYYLDRPLISKIIRVIPIRVDEIYGSCIRLLSISKSGNSNKYYYLRLNPKRGLEKENGYLIPSKYINHNIIQDIYTYGDRRQNRTFIYDNLFEAKDVLKKIINSKIEEITRLEDKIKLRLSNWETDYENSVNKKYNSDDNLKTYNTNRIEFKNFKGGETYYASQINTGIIRYGYWTNSSLGSHTELKDACSSDSIVLKLIVKDVNQKDNSCTINVYKDNKFLNTCKSYYQLPDGYYYEQEENAKIASLVNNIVDYTNFSPYLDSYKSWLIKMTNPL